MERRDRGSKTCAGAPHRRSDWLLRPIRVCALRVFLEWLSPSFHLQIRTDRSPDNFTQRNLFSFGCGFQRLHLLGFNQRNQSRILHASTLLCTCTGVKTALVTFHCDFPPCFSL